MTDNHSIESICPVCKGKRQGGILNICTGSPFVDQVHNSVSFLEHVKYCRQGMALRDKSPLGNIERIRSYNEQKRD